MEIHMGLNDGIDIDDDDEFDDSGPDELVATTPELKNDLDAAFRSYSTSAAFGAPEMQAAHLQNLRDRVEGIAQEHAARVHSAISAAE
jgi:hypothetical protein